MWQATMTFLGVILGAAIAGSVSLWREQVVTARERAAQQVEREQRRKDVRDAFQRESLLALQDAMEDCRRATVTVHFQVTEESMKRGAWKAPGVGSPAWEQWRERDVIVKKLQARVFDAELKRLVKAFSHACYRTVSASDARESIDQVNAANVLAQQVDNRIEVLLPELY